MTDFPELPDSLLPRRGLDISPNDAAEIGVQRILSLSESELDDAIEDIERRMFGGQTMPEAFGEHITREGWDVATDATDPSTLFVLGSIRMVLRTRKLALQHAGDIGGQDTREMARILVAAMVALDQARADANDIGGQS